MKKVIALLVAMSTTAAFAGVDYASSYVFRGSTVNDSAAIQPSMDTSILGIDIGAWASYDTGADTFEEVDLAIGYDVTEIAGVSVSVGLCEYIYAGEELGGTESDTEASIYLDYSIAGVDLSAALNKVIDGGMADYTILGASYGFDVSAGISGAISYEVGDADGTVPLAGVPTDVDGEVYSAVTISAETSLTDALDLGLAYTSISEGDSDGYVGDDDVLVVSISGDLF